MTDTNGNPYFVNADHEATPGGSSILQRDNSGRPTRFRFRSHKDAEKTFESMNLSLDDPKVIIETITEPLPTLCTAWTVGGPGCLRGILKIAYEFALGHQKAQVTEVEQNKRVQDVILNALDPAPYVRWLPFDFLSSFEADQAPYFSHRIIAWQDDSYALIIVELFNVYPFIIRLPGVLLRHKIVFNQGLDKTGLSMTEPIGRPAWGWHDVALDALPTMTEEIRKRLGIIIEAMTARNLIRTLNECVKLAFSQSPSLKNEAELIQNVVDHARKLLPSFPPATVDEWTPLIHFLINTRKAEQR